MFLNTIIAFLSALTAGIYTWSCFKTHPLTWPLAGLTALLWGCSLSLIIRFLLCVVAVDHPDEITIAISPLIITGYSLFLIGTFRAGPIGAEPPPPED